MGGARPTPGLTVVGAGRLATALVPALVHGGIKVRLVITRRAAAARRLSARAGGIPSSTSLVRAARESGAVLLAVSDRAIGELAAELAEVRNAVWQGRVVLHCAGALGPDVLDPLAAAGASVGVLHPLQCLGDTKAAARLLTGAYARIEGAPRASGYARQLARAVGLRALPEQPWDSRRRGAYHAAAALASNDVVALLADAIALLEGVGFDRHEALAALLPLTRGTLEVLAETGVGGALTGPAVRGDTATLRAHQAHLREIAPDSAEAHDRLSRRLRDLARANTRRR